MKKSKKLPFSLEVPSLEKTSDGTMKGGLQVFTVPGGGEITGGPNRTYCEYNDVCFDNGICAHNVFCQGYERCPSYLTAPGETPKPTPTPTPTPTPSNSESDEETAHYNEDESSIELSTLY